MNQADKNQACRIVWARMARWEADFGTGSARTEFAASWHDAIASVAPAEPATPLELDAAWQAWLRSGTAYVPPSSREPGAEG